MNTDFLQLSFKVLDHICDGEIHATQKLADELGVSLSCVLKSIKLLKKQGVNVNLINRTQCQIAGGIELLRKPIIKEQFKLNVSTHLHEIEIVPILDSTNHYLQKKLKDQPVSGQVVLAEMQTAGKGQCGRIWYSPLASSIYCSLSWSFNKSLAALSGLSLAIGVAIVQALEEYEPINSLGLKWPNDVYCRGRKLAGVLIETANQSKDNNLVVIGIGLNVKIPTVANAIDQPWTDAHHIFQEPPSRNKLIGLLINHVVSTAIGFEENGLVAFLSDWDRYDIMRNQQITAKLSRGSIIGIAEGVTQQGELMITDLAGRKHQLRSGEISVQASSGILE